MTGSGRDRTLKADVAVVGAGLIGSAAARHLARAGRSVVLVGPDEPGEASGHVGVWASHYDEARITRIADPNPVWAELARRSIRSYAELQRTTGIAFHEPRGFLRADPEGSELLDAVERVSRRVGASVARLDARDLKERFPAFRFPANYGGIAEGGAAGIVNPRAMLRAQQAAFATAGGTLVRDTVLFTERSGERWEIATLGGATILARSVLVATGAFANRYEVLPGRLPVRVEVETVWLGRVSDPEALGSMPGLWCELDWHPSIPHVYVLPPVTYPDGRRYVKIGADRDIGISLETLEDVSAFFDRGGSAERAAELAGVLGEIMPGTAFSGGRSKPCILCYTDHGLPYVDRLEDGFFVAVGGNGAAAKSSDEIGKMAAALVRQGRWMHDLDASHFALA